MKKTFTFMVAILFAIGLAGMSFADTPKKDVPVSKDSSRLNDSKSDFKDVSSSDSTLPKSDKKQPAKKDSKKDTKNNCPKGDCAPPAAK